jgi:hypothetical protein
VILVPGLEARHTWDGVVTLNDPDVWPQYRLKRIDGLHSLADVEDHRDAATARRGEIERRAVRRGKTMVYVGRIVGRSIPELEMAGAALRHAFEPVVRKQMVITPHPSFAPVLLPGVQYGPLTFEARPLGLEIPEELVTPRGRASYGYERPFTLNLRMPDPRFYQTTQLGPFETSLLASGTGQSLPWQFPVTLSAPGSSSGTVAVDNTGDVDADPIIDVYGPVTNPEVRNDTLDKDLIFQDITVAAGSFLRVNFRDRTVLLDGVSDFRGKLNLEVSDWWDTDVPGLTPGLNTIRFRGENAADPARAVITFYPATT